MRLSVSAACAALICLVVPGVPVSSAAEPAGNIGGTVESTDRAGRFLPRPAHGDSAVDDLRGKLDEVARLNGLDTSRLRRILKDDPSAWVHPTGALYYQEPLPDHDTEEMAPRVASYPSTETFALYSKPGSSRTIYLDFDGFDPAGTAWTDDAYFPLGPQPAFSRHSDSPEFDDGEHALIQSVWQRVSEDYAPFDVDVTTADPGRGALARSSRKDRVYGMRVVVTSTPDAASALCGSTCGGVAMLGTFDRVGSEYYQPAWVFARSLGLDTKAIAEAASHEVGHTLGLEHDGYKARGWSPSHDYYEGHGVWAPIMGDPSGRPISQWSSGEYADATNHQDDLEVIRDHGLSFVRDDHGDSLAAATTVGVTRRTAHGLVGTRRDRDYFSFTQQCAGPVAVTVRPADTSPNLDARLRLFDARGNRLGTSDPLATAATRNAAKGLAAEVTYSLRKGSVVYAEVDGVGARNPATSGYSDYASLGRYTIGSSDCTRPVLSFDEPTYWWAEGAANPHLTVRRTGNTAVATSVHYAVTGGDAVAGTDYVLEPGVVSFGPGETTRQIPLALPRDPWPEPQRTLTVTLEDPAAYTLLGAPTTAEVVVEDSDQLPAVDIAAVGPVSETAGTFDLVITRSQNLAVPVTVEYGPGTQGTATEGEDYTFPRGTLELAPGETRRIVPITVVDDASAEPDETVYVTAGYRTDRGGSGDVEVIRIVDDEQTAIVGFAEPTVAVQEDAGGVDLTVTRTGNTTIASSVRYEKLGAWDSVLLEPGTIEFAPGETSKTLHLTVVDDDLPDLDDHARITLQDAGAGTWLARPTATVTVLANDQQPDALVGRTRDGPFAGMRVHNDDATDQTVVSSAGRGEMRSFFVQVTNNGTAAYGMALDFALTGATTGPGASVRYFDRGTDVTSAMASPAGYAVTFTGDRPGILLRVDITTGRRAEIGSVASAWVTATWSGDVVLSDVVRAKVNVKR